MLKLAGDEMDAKTMLHRDRPEPSRTNPVDARPQVSLLVGVIRDVDGNAHHRAVAVEARPLLRHQPDIDVVAEHEGAHIVRDSDARHTEVDLHTLPAREHVLGMGDKGDTPCVPRHCLLPASNLPSGQAHRPHRYGQRHQGNYILRHIEKRTDDRLERNHTVNNTDRSPRHAEMQAAS